MIYGVYMTKLVSGFPISTTWYENNSSRHLTSENDNIDYALLQYKIYWCKKSYT